MSNAIVPPYSELLWPTLGAVEALGGSGAIEEIVGEVVKRERFSEAQQQVPQGDGPQSKLEYRLAWARTYLKFMGLLENSSRGVWALTDRGRSVTEDEILPMHREYTRRRAAQTDRKRPRADEVTSPSITNSRAENATTDDVDDAVADWRDELLEALMSMAPDAFERLAQRLLREAGFTSATVTGRSGDGGIDGLGTYRLSLLSFPVFFQCKRYRGSVGSGAVRDFRGAMAGRGDKGLLISTGTFTGEAKMESTRDGAPPVDLIDGSRLCDLLKSYEIGVCTTTRQVEDVVVDREFFLEL